MALLSYIITSLFNDVQYYVVFCFHLFGVPACDWSKCTVKQRRASPDITLLTQGYYDCTIIEEPNQITWRGFVFQAYETTILNT